jgi:hypothetical protein
LLLRPLGLESGRLVAVARLAVRLQEYLVLGKGKVVDKFSEFEVLPESEVLVPEGLGYHVLDGRLRGLDVGSVQPSTTVAHEERLVLDELPLPGLERPELVLRKVMPVPRTILGELALGFT